MWMVKETGFSWRNQGDEGAPYQIRKREGGADEEKQQNVPGLSPVALQHEKTGGEVERRAGELSWKFSL